MVMSDDQLPKETRLKIDELANLAENLLPLQRWGFVHRTRFGGMPYELPTFLDDGSFHLTRNPAVIYDSKWCRIKLTISNEEHGDKLYFYYGRLHAPNNEWRIMWQGEKCSCWYSFYHYNLALKFLDGLSPKQAKLNFNTPDMQSRHGHAKVIADYYKQMRAISSLEPEDDIEIELKLHARIWDHYGDRFFEVFDLNHPQVWNQYVDFLTEFTRLQSPAYPVKLKLG
jgi:hypothetical protein